ncbi:HNH endonuclease signature motif containing protein, partial [Cellulomonas rhizosphaerae]
LMVPPTKDDTRTTPQRRGQALADLARLALEQGMVGGGSDVRPHLSCVVDFETLQRAVRRAYRQPDDQPDAPIPGGVDRADGSVPSATPPPDPDPDTGPGPGTGPQPDSSSGADARSRPPVGLRHRSGRPARGPRRLPPISDIDRFAVTDILGGGTLPGPVLARLACDGELTRLVFGPSSQLIDVGRAERTFSGPRRRAIVARDRTCRYPGCTAPPALGELHHVEHWADGGSTDANSGILLCWYHHDLVHRLRIEIRRSPSGGWTFVTRHGLDVAA